MLQLKDKQWVQRPDTWFFFSSFRGETACLDKNLDKLYPPNRLYKQIYKIIMCYIIEFGEISEHLKLVLNSKNILSIIQKSIKFSDWFIIRWVNHQRLNEINIFLKSLKYIL
jgi:hypothetical protein